MNSSDDNSTEISSPSIATYLYYLIPVKLLIGIINFIFNGYIIRLVVFKIRKKTYSNILFLFNAIADFTSGLISIPSMTLFTTMGYWPLGKVTCLIWVINDFSVTSISAYTLLIIAIHRYLQIIRPMKTKEKMTNTKWTIIALQWFLTYAFWAISAIVISLPPDFAPEYCYFTYTFAYVFSSDFIFYCFPVLGVFIFNSLIFYELLKKKSIHKKILPNTNVSLTMTNKTVGNRFSEIDDVSRTAEGSIGSHSNKPMDARSIAMSTDKRQTKALVCLYVIAGLLILLFAIFVVTWPLKAFRSDLVSDLILEIGYWTCYSYSSINPIILLVFHDKFNKEFQKSIKKRFFKHRH